MTARAIEGHGGVSNKAARATDGHDYYEVYLLVSYRPLATKNTRDTHDAADAGQRSYSTPSAPRLQRAGEKRSHTAQANHILKKR